MRLKHNKYEYTRGKSLCPLFLFLTFAFSWVNADAEESLLSIEEKYEALIDSAECYASNHRWEEAEKTTVAALQLRPANKANWLLWSNLAEIRLKRNNPAGALEA
ncbi:MAG: hypothetical protein K2J70_08365, partial [Muribaculaceae bacterium]|nr:hypothetical protein [Muribaculaceae bacterium]